MRHWFLGAVVVLVGASVAAADDKADALVKKAIEAHGGADALNKYKAGKFTMKGEMSIMGLDLEFTGDAAYSLPDRFKMNMSSDIMGMKLEITQVVKGDAVKNSVKVGGMAQPAGGEDEKKELKMAAVLQEIQQFTPLLDAKKYTLATAADEDVNGKKAAVLVITPKAVDKEVKLWLDKETHLPVKVGHKGLGIGDAGAPTEVYEESYPTDYKKVNGIPVATKIVVNHDGKKFLTFTISDIELVEKIDDKEFGTDD